MRTRADGRLAVAIALLPFLAAPAPAQTEEPAGFESFLLPGVDVASMDLRVGAWCQYIVVDEALGVVDSASFYIAVLDSTGVGGDGAYWVEIESGPLGAPPSEREAARVLVSADLVSMARGDSLYHYVHELYIRKGNEPVRPADPVDLKRLTLANPTSKTHWNRQQGVSVSTPMGNVVCDRKELTVEESREIPTGRVKLVRRKHDHFLVWTTSDVPVFGLVKCVIERTRESRTIPPVPGIPDSGARESRTTAVVVACGEDAKPIITLP